MDGWCHSEFGAINFGDKRLNNRFIRVAEKIVGNPTRSISEACGEWADAKAAYRMFDNERLSSAKILEEHRKNTINRAKDKSVVLAVQDSSILNYGRFASIVDMGTVEGSNTWTHKGLVMHPTLAVTPNGDCLGLLDLITYSRADGKRRKKHYDHLKLPITKKESYRWLRAMRSAHADIGQQTTLVMVGDREADIYELFQEASKTNEFFLVRVCKDRQLLYEDQETSNIGDKLAEAEVRGTFSVNLEANKNRKARTALVEIKFSEVLLKPAIRRKSARLEKLLPQLVWAVSIHETQPPTDTEPLSWTLITNHPVETLAEACEKLQWYKRRWMIETYFRTLKSGFKIEATRLNRQIKIDRYITLVAALCIRVMNLAHLRDDTEDVSASEKFSPAECEILKTRRNLRTGRENKTIQLKDAIGEVALLGGFLGRTNDGPPGATVIWRGLQRLTDIENEWQLLAKLVGKS